MKTDEELKQENPELYRIARENGTEPRFSSEFTNLKADGMFHCAVCAAALFPATAKFDSKSGWPSFTDPVHETAVTLVHDDSHGMRRTEVRCASCNAHLGHVFPDGPEKTDGGRHDRFCINGISLTLESDSKNEND